MLFWYVWPVVESALLEHDMSGELVCHNKCCLRKVLYFISNYGQVDNCMRVSTTEKTRDPKILDKAKGLALFFPCNVVFLFKDNSIPRIYMMYIYTDFSFLLENSKHFFFHVTGCYVIVSVSVTVPFDIVAFDCYFLYKRQLLELLDIDMLRIDVLEMIQDTDVLEKIAEKFSSWDSPEVHANTAETLCAVARFAPPGLATKISSPSFMRRLFRHALEDSRPQYVLINLLSVCLYMLDPTRLNSRTYENFGGLQITHGSVDTANSETVVGMLEILGDLLKLLDVSTADNVLLTTYGKLQVGGETVEKELIRLGAIQRILDLFFKYPYNNFVHHHIENIIVSCLESKNAPLVQYLLCECDLVGKILTAENNYTLETDPNRPTVPDEGRSPPRLGNIGHLTRISNKIIQLGNNNSEIQAYLQVRTFISSYTCFLFCEVLIFTYWNKYLHEKHSCQENREWTNWHTNVLSRRNTVENVFLWACGVQSSITRGTTNFNQNNKTSSTCYSPNSTSKGNLYYADIFSTNQHSPFFFWFFFNFFLETNLQSYA
ncbi:unnamed protein product [Malus baccata var. baccata]